MAEVQPKRKILFNTVIYIIATFIYTILSISFSLISIKINSNDNSLLHLNDIHGTIYGMQYFVLIFLSVGSKTDYRKKIFTRLYNFNFFVIIVNIFCIEPLIVVFETIFLRIIGILLSCYSVVVIILLLVNIWKRKLLFDCSEKIYVKKLVKNNVELFHSINKSFIYIIVSCLLSFFSVTFLLSLQVNSILGIVLNCGILFYMLFAVLYVMIKSKEDIVQTVKFTFIIVILLSYTVINYIVFPTGQYVPLIIILMFCIVVSIANSIFYKFRILSLCENNINKFYGKYFKK